MSMNEHETILMNAMYKSYLTQIENGKAPDKAQHVNTDKVFPPLIEKWGFSEVIRVCEILSSLKYISYMKGDNDVYWAILENNGIKYMQNR